MKNVLHMFRTLTIEDTYMKIIKYFRIFKQNNKNILH